MFKRLKRVITGHHLPCVLVLALVLASAAAPLHAQDEGIFVSPDSAHIYKKIEDIENRLYGRAYTSQALSQRITRVERTLFTHRQPGVLEERYHRIMQRMNEDHTSAAESEVLPMIEYLEGRLFQQEYGKMPLESRIRRLEGHVFGKTFEKYPMTVRLKKLTYAIPMTARDVRFSATQPNPEDSALDETTLDSAKSQKRPGGLVVASTRTLTGDRTRTNEREPGEVIPMASSGGRVVSTQRNAPDSWQVSTGDYFHSIHKGGRGEVLRWRTLPVKVYLRNGNAQQNIAFHKALNMWQQHFSITTVSNSVQADVIVDWQNVASGLEPISKPIIHMGADRRIRTVILVNMTPYAQLSSAEQLRGTLHQLGHAFGLWGHSDDASDVMFPANRTERSDIPVKWLRRSYSYKQPSATGVVSKPTQRDINTLTKVYEESAVADLKDYSPY